MKLHDPQQMDAYAAELVLEPFSKHLGSLHAASIYMKAARLPDGYTTPDLTGVLVTGSTDDAAFADSFGMSLPLKMCRQDVVLHELAHILDRRLVGSHLPHHGPSWAGYYAALVEGTMGELAASTLRAAFVAHGVAFTTPDPHVTAMSAEIEAELVAATKYAARLSWRRKMALSRRNAERARARIASSSAVDGDSQNSLVL